MFWSYESGILKLNMSVLFKSSSWEPKNKIKTDKQMFEGLVDSLFGYLATNIPIQGKSWSHKNFSM